MSSLLVQLAVISSWLSVATSQSPPGNDMRCDPSKPPPMEPMNCSAVPVSMPMQCATIGACCLPLTSKDRCCQQAPLRLCNSINVRTVCEDMCACEWVGGSCRVAAVSRVDAGAPLDVLTCCSDPSDLPTPMPPRPSPTPLPTPMQSDGCGDSQLPFFCSGRSASASVCTSGTNHCCDWFNGACCQVGPDALCDTAMLQRSDQLCSQFCQCRWDRSRSLCERNQAWNKVDSRACCVSNRIPSISSSPAPTPVRKCPTLGIAMQCPSRSSSTCNEASTCCFSSPGGCCQLTPSGHCSQMSAAQCPGLCACELRDDTCQAARAPSFNNTDTFRIECCGGMTTRAGTAASTDDGSTPPPNEIWVPIVATIGGLVLLAVVIGLVVCFVARQRANARVKSARLESAFTESSGGGHSSALTQRPSVGSVGSNEILTSSSGVAGYDKIPARSAPEFDSARVDNDGYDLVPVVDPERRASTYSAPPIALTQLALARENSGSDAALEHELEVRFSDLRLGKQLGEGAFAKVYRGELRGREVAVKVLVGNKDDSAVEQFRKEISLMRELPPHAHVVALVGYCERPHLCICVEFCSGGSLDVYLRAHRTPLKRLLKWAADAAAGVEHLHRHNVVHRDLAVRNLLLTFENDIKVADFGLSRHTEKDAGHTKSDVGPLRWLSYESLVRKEYSPMSDAWMFGVTMWEMLSGAQLPYADLTPAQVAIQVVTADLRPQQPDGCPDDVYALMERCWKQDAIERPTFAEIGSELRSIAGQLKKKKSAPVEAASSSSSSSSD
jgi:tRNA A-37 threonylcarbamoyl transferase component Bud32